jgi:hypothetical protein
MKLKAKHPVIATDYRFSAGRLGQVRERAIGLNGEINASNKREALQNAKMLMEAASSGEVSQEDRIIRASTNKELVAAAFRDPQAHQVLGERMADEIYMTANRKGFARRFLNRMELKQGDIPRFPVRKKNVTAFLTTGPTKVETEVVTDKWLLPAEVEIRARPFVPQVEINQSPSDVLEEKYVEALEAVMVGEDRYWYNLSKMTIGVDNNLSLVSGTLNPLSLMSVRQQVAQWGLKAAYCLMASDLFIDIVGDVDFYNAIEPVARHELVMTGQLGTLYGMTLISEAYRHPEHKVLSVGEFAIVSDPLTHGAYSDRGGVDSVPIDGVTEKIAGRGWLLSEAVAFAVANSRSVAWAVRA